MSKMPVVLRLLALMTVTFAPYSSNQCAPPRTFLTAFSRSARAEARMLMRRTEERGREDRFKMLFRAIAL